MSLKKAIKIMGGAVPLAKALGISRQAVHKWNPKRIPTDYLKKIEILTGVKREELRPDLYR